MSSYNISQAISISNSFKSQRLLLLLFGSRQGKATLTARGTQQQGLGKEGRGSLDMSMNDAASGDCGWVFSGLVCLVLSWYDTELVPYVSMSVWMILLLY